MTAESEVQPFIDALRDRETPVSPVEVIGYINSVDEIYRRHAGTAGGVGTGASARPGEQTVAVAVEHIDACLKQLAQSVVEIMDTIDAVVADPRTAPDHRTALRTLLESCSFQDLVSQRLLIVRQSLLEDGRDRRKGMRTAINQQQRAEAQEDDYLLNGPALDSESVDQTDIDALFD